MAENAIDYPALVRGALQGVVREVLRLAAEDGFPGNHHLYVTIRTGAPGVEMPEWLARRYPEEMNLVLQHQFWNLEVEEDRFAVTLRFGGKPARISVPYAAIDAFLDPGAEFGLKLNSPPSPEAPEPPTLENAETPLRSDAGPATVVSLEAFRERKA